MSRKYYVPVLVREDVHDEVRRFADRLEAEAAAEEDDHR